MDQNQQKNLTELFQSQVPNPFENISDILGQFDYFVICKFCKLQAPLIFITQLIQHYVECKSTFQLSHASLFKEKEFQPFQNSTNEFYDQVIDEQKQNNRISFIQSILNIGNLSDGSKTIYQTALSKLLKNITVQDLNSIKTQEFTLIAKHQCKSLNQVNALIRFQKSLHMPQSAEFRETIKLQKRLINECVEKRPHRSWDLNLIQKFLDDLFICRRGFLAFRLYILFELAARISELSQISFEMVIKGTIHYIPQKQMRYGKKAERRFILDKIVQLQTQQFVERNSIELTQNLDIGLNKKSIKSQSFHKQLKYALKLIHKQGWENQNDYNEFLLNFQYHDLRYTKLQELYKCGMNEKIIQRFVKHSNSKTTKMYLQNLENNEFVNLDMTDLCSNENSKYQSPTIHLKFQGENDIL